MSNSITYYNRYNVKDVYDIFNKNRVNKISLGTTNAYISYAIGTDYAYIYADESSEKLNDDNIGCAYFKVNETSYNFYRNYSYTYTESVNGNILGGGINKLRPILIAYDFVNKTDDDNEFEFNHVNIAHNSGTGTVNVFSDISYNIEKENIALNNYYNKYKTYTADIKKLLNGETYGDFTTYINYSYIKSETPRTGVVHTDGKKRLFDNELNDIHVWSLKQKDNEKISYIDIEENKKIDVLAYVSYGKNFNDLPFNSYVSFDINGCSNEHNLTQLNYNVEKDSNYDTYIRIKNIDSKFLINNCYYTNLTSSSFDEIYNKPSLRNNESEIIAYAYIKGGNEDDVLYSNINNYNEVKFEKEICDLPTSILYNFLYLSKITDENGKPIIKPDTGSNGGVQGGKTLTGYIKLYSGGKIEKDTQENSYLLSYNQSSEITIEIKCTLELNTDDNVYIEAVSQQPDCEIFSQVIVDTTTYLSKEQISNDKYSCKISVKDAFTDAPYNVAYVYSDIVYVDNYSLWLSMFGWAKQNGEGTWLTTAPHKDKSSHIYLENGKLVHVGHPYNIDDSNNSYIDGFVENAKNNYNN